MLRHTLPTLFAQDYPASDYEVVVVVDGSTDGSVDYMRSLDPSCGFEVVVQENRGPAAARNAGIAAASGQFVLFTDDDIRVTPSLLREHAAGHALEDDTRVHGALFVAPESPQTLPALSTRDWYVRYDEILRAVGATREWGLVMNANSSVRAEVLADLNGFDEDIPFPREDFELALRMEKAGVATVYRPEAVAFEVFAKTSHAFVRDGALYGNAEVAICRKHPDYRPDSVLAPRDSAGPAPLRRFTRVVIPALPRGSERMLSPAVFGAEALSRWPLGRKAGVHLLGLQHRMALLRAAADATGSATEFRGEFDRRLAVLLYHRVGPGLAGLHPSLIVPPAEFERQIAWLARRGYTGIRPQQWLAWLSWGLPLPAKPVLITFDDAYAEIGEYALPVLQRHGFGALVFAVTRAFGGRNTWDSRADGAELPLLMRADEIAHWADLGVDFGAHSRHHPDLSTIPDRDLEDEVRGSREDLEAVVGRPITCFAYPYGRLSDRASQLVAASYELAFTTIEGINGLATPRHLLRRTPPSPGDTRMDIEWRARTGRSLLPGVRATLRIRSRLRAASS